MVPKLRRGIRGSRARSEPKECWQMRSQLMAGRSGRVHSVLSQMCGRGGVAGDVTENIPAGLQAGGRCKVRRTVYRLFDVEWGGRQKRSESGSREQGVRIDALEKEGRSARMPEYPY